MMERLRRKRTLAAASSDRPQSAAMFALQEQPPSPLLGGVLRAVLVLLLALFMWAALGRLDVVAVAEGKLVPQTYVKIVQSVEQGVVKEILVKEGQPVRQGQILMRMDATSSDADGKALRAEAARLRLSLRRIDAELGGKLLTRENTDAPVAYAQALAQYTSNRRAYQSTLDEQLSAQDKARQDRAMAQEIKAKLEQVLPHYVEREQAFERLSREGFAGRLMATEKQRERIEKERELKAQEYAIQSAQASLDQAQKRRAQITAEYLRQLQAERAEALRQLDRADQESAKQEHRQALLELKAPQAGIVKDLATHTVGAVAAPGTVLLTLVPKEEPLHAEVWVSNEDIGFVRPRQPVKVKLSAFSFQKYGMVDGIVEQVSADATDTAAENGKPESHAQPDSRLAYKVLVSLPRQSLSAEGQNYALAPGMRVLAEIRLGTRTVLDYLLSPIQGAFQAAARER